jgi:cytochrome P450 family 9
MGLHRDPQYWPEPDRFDPERFSEENKMKINPYTFLPFGVGPRNCIGSRFALLETKTLFFYILAHFEIVPVEKTQIPLQLSRKTFAMTAEKGFWLGFKRRVKI